MPESTDIVDTATAVGSSLDADHEPDLPRLITESVQIDEAELDAARAAHVRFKYSRPGSQPGLSTIEGLIPVHLYQLTRFERVRADYPAFFPSDGGRPTSLTFVIDDVIERSDTEGDERRYFQQSVLRLELAMRKLVDAEGEFELSSLWNAALEQSEARLSPDRRESVLQHLRDARALLNVTGSVVPFGAEAALALLRRTSRRFATEKTRLLQEELEQLSLQTRALLDVDRSERPDAHSPDILEQSVGESFSDELDFEALSSLMDKGPHGVMLSDDRRSRIESVLVVLSNQLAALQSKSPDDDAIQMVESANELSELTELHRKRCLELVKAVQIARLETSDQYDEVHHGPQFEAFGVDQLSTADLFSLPAAPAIVRGGHIDDVERFLQTSLDRARPHKVVLLIDSPIATDGGTGFSTPVSLRLLAGGRPDSLIYQVGLSNLDAVAEAFEEALAFSGPSVVCIYVGSSFGSEVFHPYLRAAAACDARVFPLFANDPGKGALWADRFNIDRNADHSQSWPVSAVRYLDDEDSESEEIRPFTAADFMAMDDRFFSGFRQISQKHWHDDLVPIHDYLTGDYGEETVPFILMVDSDGMLVRVVCSERIVEWTEQIGLRWRSLQELGGVENSHAGRLLEIEKQRMEEASRIRVEEAEAVLREQLEQKTGTLAEQIISNIASGLLGADLTTALIPVQSPAVVEAVKAAGVVEVAVAEEPAADDDEEEDDDELSFDEAYIETPRCTTCDECTAINPRLFAYDENKQAYIVDVAAGSFREMVMAAEKCPVKIIHTGKPQNPDEPHLEELIARAEAFR